MDTRKLGKKPYVEDPRSLQLAKYMKALPAPPASVSWMGKVSTWPAYGNLTIGDCTCAACGHMIESWTADVGTEFSPLDADILTAYEAVSGYNPTTGANDDGAECKTVLKYWQTTGIAGHKIGAYAEIDPSDDTTIRQAIDLFGGVYIGLALPLAAQTMQGVWTDPPAPKKHESWWEEIEDVFGKTPAAGLSGEWAPGSWGGHCIPLFGFDPNSFSGPTWGEAWVVNLGFATDYIDEVWVPLSTDFIASDGQSASGFDLAQLKADLAAI